MANPRTLVTQAPRPVSAAMPVLEQERAIMTVAETHDWPFRVLGIAPVPARAVYYNQWWLVPVTQDRSQMPTRTLERVQAIFAAGIRPKAFVIAHEAPAQIAPPPDAPQVSRLEFWASQVAAHSVTALKVTGKVVAVALPIIGTILGVSALAVLGLTSVILTDPCLIVVTEDDVWIQIDYWMS